MFNLKKLFGLYEENKNFPKGIELTYPEIYSNFKVRYEEIKNDLKIILDDVYCPMCKSTCVICTQSLVDNTYYVFCKNCWHCIR